MYCKTFGARNQASLDTGILNHKYRAISLVDNDYSLADMGVSLSFLHEELANNIRCVREIST